MRRSQLSIGHSPARTEARQRGSHAVGVRQADHGIRTHDPDRFHLAAPDRVEQLDRLEARFGRHRRRVPEPLDESAMRRVLDLQVRGKLVGQAADLAAAHRIRLTGQRERPHSRPADAAGKQVTVNDRVELVGTAR